MEKWRPLEDASAMRGVASGVREGETEPGVARVPIPVERRSV